MPIISLPKIFKVSKGNNTATVQILKGVLSHMNCLVKEKTPIILVNNDKVVLYVPVDFNNLQVRIVSMFMFTLYYKLVVMIQ